MKTASLASLVAVLLLSLSACGGGDSSFRVVGRFRDMQQGELYVYNLSSKHARLDTVSVKEGRFVYAGQAEQCTPYILVFPNAVEQVLFAQNGQDLRYEATANDLRNYVVNGSKENKLMNRFREETYRQGAQQIVATARRYIEQHTPSPVAVYLFDRYFVQNEATDGAELKPLLARLLKAHPDNRFLLDVKGSLSVVEAGQVGSALPDLSLKARSGAGLSLRGGGRQYTLVAFWATWMRTQWETMSRLRSLHDKYGRAGLRIVAVSLDTEIYKWEEFTRADSLSIVHVCDGRAWESAAVRKLGVRLLPCYVLADRDDKVVARGTDINAMVADVEKFLKPSGE